MGGGGGSAGGGAWRSVQAVPPLGDGGRGDVITVGQLDGAAETPVDPQGTPDFNSAIIVLGTNVDTSLCL